MEFSPDRKPTAVTKSIANAVRVGQACLLAGPTLRIKRRWLQVSCAISALFWFKRKLMRCMKILLSFSPYGYSKEKRIFPSSPGPGD